MKRVNILAIGIFLLSSGVMGMTSQAHATGYCSGGTATEGISVGDVTFNNLSANDCYGVVSGNITGGGTFAGAPVLNSLNWDAGWTYLDSSGASVNTFMGLAFTVTPTSGSSGTWTLTGLDTNGAPSLNFPASLDLVVGLKAGNEYALWGFDNVTVDGSDSGTFTISFTNNGGNHPALSHMILFGREAAGGSIAAIPEASTYAMMLAGLGLVSFTARRRAKV